MSGSISKTVLVGMTFLVIDDEPDNVGVVVKLLTLMGARALSAENGKQGLEVARTAHPDVILCDLSMSVMSGWETLYEIRQDSELKDIPVIALTAHAMAGDRQRVVQAGFNNYIAKPIDVPKFIPMFISMLKAIPRTATLIES